MPSLREPVCVAQLVRAVIWLPVDAVPEVGVLQRLGVTEPLGAVADVGNMRQVDAVHGGADLAVELQLLAAEVAVEDSGQHEDLQDLPAALLVRIGPPRARCSPTF